MFFSVGQVLWIITFIFAACVFVFIVLYIMFKEHKRWSVNKMEIMEKKIDEIHKPLKEFNKNVIKIIDNLKK